MNRIITIDTMTKEFPNFISKETKPQDQNGWIMCLMEVRKGELWEGKVISISTMGKYKVELLKRDE